MSNRAPPAAHRPGAAVHATRQAAGEPSARSQPSPVTPARPRRWCDAGPPAARSAEDQKAGAPGHHATRTEAHPLQGSPPSPARRVRYKSRTASTTLKVGLAPPYVPNTRAISRSPGRAGFDIVPAMSIRSPLTHRTMSNRATLAAKRFGAPLQATRQAAGVPSVRSQPSPVTPARPRRWCDAGPPAARAAEDQKAGAPGHQATRTASRLPERPAASRTRDRFRIQTDGQAGRPPPQCAPDRRRSGTPPQRSASAISGSASAGKQHPAPAYANLSRSPGRVGFDIVPATTHRPRLA